MQLDWFGFLTPIEGVVIELTPYRFVADSSQFKLTKLIWGLQPQFRDKIS